MTVAELTELLGAVGSFLTPIGVIVTAIGVIMSLMGQKKLRDDVTATRAEVGVVKKQNDGVIARLELSRDASREETKTAVADATLARTEKVAAEAAGVAAVVEANRTHEASSAAVEKGARDAVEPIAEKAVTEGAKAAVAEMKREDEDGKK